LLCSLDFWKALHKIISVINELSSDSHAQLYSGCGE
jgi:hypothetical protein